MNLVKLSNIFNLIVQNHPDFEHYHCGPLSDINTNIFNNYDQGNIGQTFPAVHLLLDAQGTVDLTRSHDTLQVELFFWDLLDYNNDSTPNTKTHLEQLSELQGKAIAFFREIAFVSKDLAKTQEGKMFIVNNSFDFDSGIYAGNDRLVFVDCRFELVLNLECPPLVGADLTGDIDRPYPPTSTDYER